MMNRSCRQIASWHLIAVGVSMKISRDDKPEKNPLFFLKLTSPKTARKFSFRNIYRNINFWLPTLINKKKGIVKIQQTVTLQTSIPTAAWVNQTSCQGMSEMNFVNEITNENQSSRRLGYIIHASVPGIFANAGSLVSSPLLVSKLLLRETCLGAKISA